MAITAAQRQNKITNARAAVLAGTGRQLTLVMVNTNMVFRSPKYYQELRKYRKEKELRERNNLDQAISGKNSTECKTRSPGPGLKLPGPRPISNANKGLIHRRQAPSTKPQASSSKRVEKFITSAKPQA
tara:strand:+ start:1094 stop:1480 length:387 start_codon:yes stop_codon:yes gene_type:complete